MIEYTLDKIDFKKYLINHLPDTRQEDLIFWKNNIPMPVDLIYNIFERRGILLSKYLDHIGAAYLYAYSLKKQQENWIEGLSLQPTKGNIQTKGYLRTLFKNHMEESGVEKLLAELSEMLLIESYTTDNKSLVEALCHEGRKYKRLFIPYVIKERVMETFPELLNYIAVSNHDMFSNVVADELKIYRMGFADAFTGIFNKLIDFILRNSSENKRKYASTSGIKIVQEKDKNENVSNIEISYGYVSDGSIWEPKYTHSKSTYILNSQHPFCDMVRKKSNSTEEMIVKLISVMAARENEMLKDAQRKIIEDFRQDVSRELRTICEKELTDKT